MRILILNLRVIITFSLIFSFSACEDNDEVIHKTGDIKELSDIDGNEYKAVRIGDLWWMTENLKTSRFANGDPISTGYSNLEWRDVDYSAYTIYPIDDISQMNSEQDMIDAYGVLYNWYAVDDNRGLCPEGWRVFNDEDWINLRDFIIENNERVDDNNYGRYIKSCKTYNYYINNECRTELHPRWSEGPVDGVHGLDEYGLNVLPAGQRNSLGNFVGIGEHTCLWSKTESSEINGRRVQLFYDRGNVFFDFAEKIRAYSVRCVKN